MLTGVDEVASAVEQWRAEGWGLVPELIPRAEAEFARAEIEGRDLDPPLHRGPLRRSDAREPAPDEPAFREEQFAGTTLFPIPDAPRLNRLLVHPALVGFARAALGTDDVRIYQSRLWSKFGDRASYEQPLHRDGNHSLVPTRSEPGWWFCECFLYLSDVDAGNGAPHLVPRSASVGEPPGRGLLHPGDEPDLYAHEVAAAGPAGSLLAYRSDVWHRGMPIQPGAERHVLVVAFKPAGLEWIGFDAHPPLVNNRDFVRFAEACTPDELALFGVPRPGHPYWTPDTVAAMAHIYPRLDLDPWRSALDSA
jgi:hypothetical protein